MISSLLNKIASITRYAVTQESGPDPTEEPSVIASDVPCRLTVRSGAETIQVAEATVVNNTIFFNFGQDVLEKDEITIDGKVYYVQLVNPNPGDSAHHVEVQASQVR